MRGCRGSRGGGRRVRQFVVGRVKHTLVGERDIVQCNQSSLRFTSLIPEDDLRRRDTNLGATWSFNKGELVKQKTVVSRCTTDVFSSLTLQRREGEKVTSALCQLWLSDLSLSHNTVSLVPDCSVLD